MLRLIFLFLIFVNIAFASPYELRLKKETKIIGLAFGLGIFNEIKDKNSYLKEDRILDLDKDDINVIDRSAVYNYSESSNELSTVLVLLALSAPSIFIFDEEIKEDYLTVGTLYLETISMTYFTTQFAKTMIDRKRPYLYGEKADIEDKLDDDSANSSFFSGHTSMAFASTIFMAKVYLDYHPESKMKKYVWAGAIGTGMAVGGLRYHAGKHYPSDIVVGALLGSFYGYYIPEIHKKERDYLIIPESNGDNIKLSFIYKF